MRYLRFVLLGLLALAALVASPIGASTGTTERVSVASDGTEGNGDSRWSAISADGRYVAFVSGATNLVPDDTDACEDTSGNPVNCPDVFVHDRQTGANERVSVDSAGNEGNGASVGLPPTVAISADGRYVAFVSGATNLVPDDTNDTYEAFVHDRQTGATERVSVDSSGNEGNGWSLWPAISIDGRYVAFVSGATNLVPDDTDACEDTSGNPVNCFDIFVHDRQTGATERVSVDSSGNEGNGDSRWSAISADGRYVAFASDASNLVSGDTNGTSDIFVHDRQTGATERVSVDSAGNEGNSDSHILAISADGRYVAFSSSASNLVPDDTNDTGDAFVHDRQTGATERVSVDSSGNEGNSSSGGDIIDGPPAISADGRYVAFVSRATNLVPDDTNDTRDVFVHDRQTGATERVSVDSAGNEGNSGSYELAISGDGRLVAFSSSASNLVPDDTNDTQDVFVHDRSLCGIAPWFVPAGDSDCDGFTDVEEGFVGTDDADACPDDPDDDAWPADMTHASLGYGKHDGRVDILDIVQLTPPYFGSSPPNPNYSIRKDLDGSGVIDILDIVRLTPPVFGESCTP